VREGFARSYVSLWKAADAYPVTVARLDAYVDRTIWIEQIDVFASAQISDLIVLIDIDGRRHVWTGKQQVRLAPGSLLIVSAEAPRLRIDRDAHFWASIRGPAERVACQVAREHVARKVYS